jgi:alkanesulfonate monooxygenase SsuD/methylene tetrahydromethanopterin reductase-like flavin-dependent oxidoreductase (luciferase family)
MVIADTRQEALGLGMSWSRSRFETYVREGIDRDLPTAGSLEASNESTIEERFILGPPGACAEAIQRLREETGLTHLVLKPQWIGLDHMTAVRQLERFGRDVMPLVGG